MYLTKVWAPYFKKGTTTLLRFGMDVLGENPSTECNYFLLNVILKDYYNTNLTYNIKKYIIKGYKKLFNEHTEDDIMRKWQQENKSTEAVSVFNSRSHLQKLELIIQSSEYRLTVIDVVMFMASLNIPILFIYQSKKTENNDGIKIFYMMESDYYYVIKLRNNKIFMLHMWTFRKNTKKQISMIKFYKEILTLKLKHKMIGITSFDRYLKSKL